MRRGEGGGEGHDKLCKLFWRVNIFSAPGMGRVSPKLVGQNKNAPALPPLIYDRSLNWLNLISKSFSLFSFCLALFFAKIIVDALISVLGHFPK